MRERIEQKLSTLNLLHIEVIDESHKHQGHAGYKEGGETHFKVIIVSDDFADQNRVSRHRTVYDLLQDELNERVHALAIQAYSKDEYEN